VSVGGTAEHSAAQDGDGTLAGLTWSVGRFSRSINCPTVWSMLAKGRAGAVLLGLDYPW
jgi:hypothetical protein